MVNTSAIVIALGGNALLQKGESYSYENLVKNARRTAKVLAKPLSNRRFVITHGNGPQVGDELLRNINARKEIPELPLHILTAETQATIGSILETSFLEEFEKTGDKKDICVLETHVLVSKKDRAFGNPAKPIGPFYSKFELDKELKRSGFDYVRESKGFRRVVPSPEPIGILEKRQILSLVSLGYGVICCGGGGIPMARKNGNNGTYAAVEAVIDKDKTTRLLANLMNANEMVILTDVDYVHGHDNMEPIKKIKASALEKDIPKFEDGTMRPKLEAATEFIKKGGRIARIGNLYKADKVLSGESGTLVF